MQHLRYGLIADVLRVPPGSRETRRTLHEKAQRTYVIPGTRRSRVAVETMRDCPKTNAPARITAWSSSASARW